MNLRIPVIIPSYEPDQRLTDLLRDLTDSNISDIVIVNDGSDSSYDHFFKTAENNFGCTVLTHPENRGKGAALKTAFRWCLENIKNLKGTITADSDGQHSPKCIRNCMDALAQNPDSLIMGCRDFTQPDVPPKSVLGNNNTNKIIYHLYGKKLSDTQTGLRGLPKKIMEMCLGLKGNRFEFEIQMISLAMENNIQFTEVPIETIYDSREKHKTHFRPVRDTIKIYTALGLSKCLRILLFKKS